MNEDVIENQTETANLVLRYILPQDCIKLGCYCLEETLENDRGIVSLEDEVEGVILDAYATVEEYDAFIAELEATFDSIEDIDSIVPEELILNLMHRNLIKTKDYR